MAKVSAASSKGGTSPDAAVSTASADQRTIAQRPIAVAALEARVERAASVMGAAELTGEGGKGKSGAWSGRRRRRRSRSARPPPERQASEYLQPRALLCYACVRILERGTSCSAGIDRGRRRARQDAQDHGLLLRREIMRQSASRRRSLGNGEMRNRLYRLARRTALAAAIAVVLAVPASAQDAPINSNLAVAQPVVAYHAMVLSCR